MSHYTMRLTAALIFSSGIAQGSTNAYPDCIASSNEIGMRDIASRMFSMLPAGHQAKIAEQGGIGSEGYDHAHHDHAHDHDHDDTVDRSEEIDPGITAHEYLELIISDELAARLTPEQWNIFNETVDTLDSGKTLPALCFAPGTDLEFAYAINQLMEFPFQVRFQQTSRWSRTATDGAGLSQGEPTTLTYSFVPDGTFIPNLGFGLGSGSSVLFAWLNSRYGSPSDWQPLFHQVFDRWEELTGLTYVHETNDDGANTNGALGVLGVRGDVRIGAFNFANDGNFGVLAYNNFPNDGDMIFDAYDNYYNNTSANSRSLRNVIAHEHGHGLGMLHVCPISQTKLMEPFATNSFDGPQLDDILNGHRHYGDPTEPNNDLPEAIMIGSMAPGDFWSLDNISIDDNSDIDIFRLDLSERSKLTFLVGPQAAQYRSGPQTQQCNNGTLINYNAIQDLKIDLYSAGNLIIPLISVNSEGAGGLDTLTYDLETAGTYYLIVSAASNVNNVQRYQTTAFTQELPPVECPADLNGDGTLDFFDVSAFLSNYNNMNVDADFNGDGNFDFFDVSAFLNAYNAGCP